MRSVAYVPHDKKELVKEVHRLAWLGARLEASPKRGTMVHHHSNHL